MAYSPLPLLQRASLLASDGYAGLALQPPALERQHWPNIHRAAATAASSASAASAGARKVAAPFWMRAIAPLVMFVYRLRQRENGWP